LKQAIALDPSDSWSYADMAQSLAWNGRPAEAIPYMKTAMRIDPNYPPQYSFILGLAQFGMGQFEAAVKNLENATRHGSGHGVDRHALLFLASTYGYLGRKQEAATELAQYNSLITQDGHAPANLTGVRSYYKGYYEEPKDAERLVQGLRLAGVPEN
jgi:adenylate cyclase